MIGSLMQMTSETRNSSCVYHLVRSKIVGLRRLSHDNTLHRCHPMLDPVFAKSKSKSRNTGYVEVTPTTIDATHHSVRNLLPSP